MGFAQCKAHFDFHIIAVLKLNYRSGTVIQ